MNSLVIAHGVSLSKARKLAKERDLDHIRIHASEEGSPERPEWIVAHHRTPNDRNPEYYEFVSGKQMLEHIRKHASVPSEDVEESKE